MKRKYETQITNHESRTRAGSALILAVVLTSLLAIVGVMFLMVARVDRMATSAISENKELNFAAETVIAKISQELVLDTPGVTGQEYYDYPDPCNAWLANLEPNDNRMWQQISNVTGTGVSWTNLPAEIIPDYQNLVNEGFIADADGDGVSDSVWVQVPDMNSSKGKPIFAAIRVIDNGGMLNVNTAHKFDPNTSDGSSQMQINLAALSQRGDNGSLAQAADDLQAWRCGIMPTDLSLYEQNVVWRYNAPVGAYTPLDISDELELRNRFLINLPDIDARIENVWTNAFKHPNLRTPVPWDDSPAVRQTNLNNWFYRTQHDVPGPNDIYSYRHIGTTYNMDRIIDPNGEKMVNINTAGEALLYAAVRTGLYDANVPGPNSLAVQMTVNIVDFRDNDSNVAVYLNPDDGKIYYGFEAQPFISEIAFDINVIDANVSTNNYFAIELYNPFEVPIPLNGFRLELRPQTGSALPPIDLVGNTIAANGRFVITNSSAASSEFGVTGLMSTGGGKEDDNLLLAEYASDGCDPPTYSFDKRYNIYLLRTTLMDPNLYLDQQNTEDSWFNWDAIKGESQFYCRADNDWNVVYQNLVLSDNTLGGANGLVGGRKNYNIPTFVGGFVTIGDIARVLTIGPSPDPCDMIGVRLAAEPPEKLVRLNLKDSDFRNIFQYLTVFDPVAYPWNDPNETRIKGRININTAPWYVIAQLPWVSAHTPNYELARAIVDYRDNTAGGFGSIGQLNSVVDVFDPNSSIDYYGRLDGAGAGDQLGFPDLTPGDGAPDDFEERDLIFARISNLVTVRSDVFTAYILVRIGTDGPQKRVIAILDRSNVYSGNDKVRIVALHPVPDPR